MVFPFGDQSPEKNRNRVFLDIVRLDDLSRFESFSIQLIEKGYGMSASFKPRTGFIALPLNQKDKQIGYVGVHVVAEQVYHGAKLYSLDEFLQKKV